MDSGLPELAGACCRPVVSGVVDLFFDVHQPVQKMISLEVYGVGLGVLVFALVDSMDLGFVVVELDQQLLLLMLKVVQFFLFGEVQKVHAFVLTHFLFDNELFGPASTGHGPIDMNDGHGIGDGCLSPGLALALQTLRGTGAPLQMFFPPASLADALCVIEEGEGLTSGPLAVPASIGLLVDVVPIGDQLQYFPDSFILAGFLIHGFIFYKRMQGLI